MNPPLDPSHIRQRLAARGISIHAAAARLRVNPGHLRRVLRGERKGNAALLQSIADLADIMDQRRRPEDLDRLIAAAVHVFLLKRARFESPICWRIHSDFSNR